MQRFGPRFLDRSDHDQLGNSLSADDLRANAYSILRSAFLLGVAEAGFFPASCFISRYGSRHGVQHARWGYLF